MTHATTWMNLENMLNERSQLQKNTYYDSVYMEMSRQANQQRQKVGQWLPGAEGRGEWEQLIMGFFWNDENVTELHSGDGCTTLCSHAIVHFKG